MNCPGNQTQIDHAGFRFRSFRLAAATNFDLQGDRSDLHGPFGHNGVEGRSPRPLFRGELNDITHLKRVLTQIDTNWASAV